jgi:AraC-like DNA-binding protein
MQLRNEIPPAEPETRGAWQARRLGDAWVPVPAGEAVWLVREGEVLLAGREYTLRLEAGSAWIDDPREPLRVRAAGGQGAVLWRLPMTGADLPAVLHDADTEFARVLATLASAGAEPEAVVEALGGAQGDLPVRIERCTGRSALRRRDQFIRLARARALLAWGDGEPADIARLAEVARLSSAHFVRLFHRVFGVPPHRYRIERRMQLAYRMIAHTPLPIGEILNHIGLGSHSTFSRSFRRHFGVSASTVRAQRLR